jgi:hypothetical protein
MLHLFLDESGECSFSPNSRYIHFLITIISVDDTEIIELKGKLKRQFAYFIRNGWDKTKEIKAYELYKNRRFGASAIFRVLSALMQLNSIKISYLVVNKNNIKHQAFRDAPYGIGYNYFTGVLLSELVFQDNICDFQLIYDEKSKETHPNRRFVEYLQTKIYGSAFEFDTNVTFTLMRGKSDEVYGLRAVDFICWSIFRKFEYGDARFLNVFSQKILRRREWYI